MLTDRYVFSQLMDFLPTDDFDRSVERYRGNRRIRDFSCLDQFLCLAFAQLTYRESLRDIETCLRALEQKALPRGISRHSSEDHTGQRQRTPRLAHLRRLRASSDRPGGDCTRPMGSAFNWSKLPTRWIPQRSTFA